MSVDIDKAKKALKDLKAKIDLVEDEDLEKNSQSVQDYYRTCKEEYIFLNGVLQNKAYDWILNKQDLRSSTPHTLYVVSKTYRPPRS
jgi:hypothetical protein